MTDNMKIWNKFADIDPKYTKAITGKDYKGTSPNPHYVIKCLTELFGPVGIGFGWRVLVEDFTTIGQETLHWCRIEFWHTSRENTYEAYGQTKATYITNAGKPKFDEDAPKKSLTDAITKAASQIGVAANIFLGRWDDSKYVAEVNGEYRAAEKQGQTDTRKPTQNGQDAQRTNPQAEAINIACNSLRNAETLDQLAAIWSGLPRNIQAHQSVIATKDERKAGLTKNADLGGDNLPY